MYYLLSQEASIFSVLDVWVPCLHIFFHVTYKENLFIEIQWERPETESRKATKYRAYSRPILHSAIERCPLL